MSRDRGRLHVYSINQKRKGDVSVHKYVVHISPGPNIAFVHVTQRSCAVVVFRTPPEIIYRRAKIVFLFYFLSFSRANRPVYARWWWWYDSVCAWYIIIFVYTLCRSRPDICTPRIACSTKENIIVQRVPIIQGVPPPESGRFGTC